jgi:ribosome recycling factor
MHVKDDTKQKMKQAVEHLKTEYRSLRTNRVNPSMLDDLKVDMYGSLVSIKSIATVSIQERQLIITPFDPSAKAAIVKAISNSPLNLSAMQEQTYVRVPVPPLNEELRKEIAKQAKQKTEAAKIVVREIRRKSNETIKKQKADGLIAEDEVKKLEKIIQELTDEHCKEMDKLFQEKEKEILTV